MKKGYVIAIRNELKNPEELHVYRTKVGPTMMFVKRLAAYGRQEHAKAPCRRARPYLSSKATKLRRNGTIATHTARPRCTGCMQPVISCSLLKVFTAIDPAAMPRFIQTTGASPPPAYMWDGRKWVSGR